MVYHYQGSKISAKMFVFLIFLK